MQAAYAHPLRVRLMAVLDERKVRVVDLFQAWDGDEDGTISLAEFEHAMEGCGIDGASPEV